MPTSQEPAIHFLETVDSTSDWAKRRAADGESFPFVCIARQQTAGRGRQGNRWESPQKGLYVTVALASGALEHEEASQLGSCGLKAALLLACWIEQRFGLAPALKWPNDLFVYDGGVAKKLAGILVESSFKGADPGPLFVGLGLNLVGAPESERIPEAGYSAVALSELGIAPQDLQDERRLAEDLGRQIVKGWQELSLADVPGAFASYRPQAMLHPYLHDDEKNTYYFPRLIGDDGSLELSVADAAPSDADEKRILSSVREPYGSVYWGDAQGFPPMIVADVGNSMIKIGAYHNAKWEHLGSAPMGENPAAFSDVLTLEALWERLRSFRQERHLPRGWPIYGISVNQSHLQTLQAPLSRDGWDLVAAMSGSHKPRRRLRQTPYALEQMGADRFAAIEGWLQKVAEQSGDPRHDVDPGPSLEILICAGTATTIDVLLRCGPFADHGGGWIIPGFGTMLESLGTAGDALPTLGKACTADGQEVSVSRQGLLGHTTQSAIWNGCLQAQWGAVMQVLRSADEAVAEWNGVPKIILAGGWSETLETFFATKTKPLNISLGRHPEVIFRGIRSLVLGG